MFRLFRDNANVYSQKNHSYSHVYRVYKNKIHFTRNTAIGPGIRI